MTVARPAVRAAAALLLAAACGVPAHGSDETIHPDSWVYEALRTFELRGLVRLEQAGPLSRDDVERAVAGIDAAAGRIDLTAHQEFLLGRLRAEFAATGGSPELREDRSVWVLRDGGRFLAIDVAAGGALRKRVERSEGEANGLLLPRILLAPGGSFVLETEYRITISPERDLYHRTGKPSPRERSWRGVTCDYERAYIAICGSGWRVQAGRDYLWWGPARREALILSSGAGSLDHVAADLALGPVTLRMIHGVLDPAIPRRLAGHRLEIRLPRGIRAGIGETVLYTTRGVDWAYLLPLSSFYANQYNESDDDNIMWSVDLSVPAAPGLILSGELLVDDYQYEDDPPAPDKLGLTIGADLLVQPWGREFLLHAGYTRLDIYTYTHKDSLRTAYLTGSGDPSVDRILGDQLGPDADRWTASLRTPVHPRAVVSLAGAYARRGEGNDMREWDWTGDPDPPLPSGAAERETLVSAALEVDLGRGSSAGAGGGWRLRSGEGGERTDTFAYLSLLWDF